MPRRIRLCCAVGHAQLAAEGLEQPQIDIKADRDDTGFDVGNRRLGRSCCRGELFLREIAGLAARTQSSACLPQAADAGWGQTVHVDVYSPCAIRLEYPL